jgi:hypothetical protein
LTAFAVAAGSALGAAGSVSTNDVTPGVLGFLVVAGIGVALVFLFRSMNKQFRKITPDPEAGDSGVGGAPGTDGAAKVGAAANGVTGAKPEDSSSAN